MAAAAFRAGTGGNEMSAILFRLRVPNAALLFLCCSMYFGTGWSMGLFSFPIKPLLTVDNYYLEFVPEVAAATNFFTYMTVVMLVCGAAMTYTEWHTKFRLVPIAVVLALIISTLLTIYVIFPYNDAMSAGIKDPAVLASTLTKWMDLNWVRISLWTVMWAVMMFWFALQTRSATP
jgi:hypothetical protein